MTAEKPLHVQVAEALGWTELDQDQAPLDHWYGLDPVDQERLAVPRYDTDWGAAGPLIEKHGLEFSVMWPGDRGQDGFWVSCWRTADSHHGMAREGVAPTHLEAVCRLILALHTAGELKERET